MPSDIIGTSVFDLSKSTILNLKRTSFSNFVLIEINRAPSNPSSTFAEVMEERQITDGTTYVLDRYPVIATKTN